MRTFLIILSVFFVGIAHAQTVGNWPLPAGYSRITQPTASFGAWLRKVPLKQSSTVYLFNGEKKRNQSAQVAVLNISTGKKDLQQCADAVMRLYAEYLYATQKTNRISFNATDGTVLDYAGWQRGTRWKLRGSKLMKVNSGSPCQGRQCLESYLEFIFSYAGTISLKKQLKTVQNVKDVIPGDVFIEAGSPGHAVIVMDVAVNQHGQKMFLLAQSYMPAQDIHLLRNPSASNAWYPLPVGNLVTPEWVFGKSSALMRFAQ
ncbi:DUF4846 domain-containing protein [Chitinophaga deserti]|uniref:DUF4846 domain-containing protein n=1 Tax=Chitinophaga deserti TaxID=2164099 RepID=UPI000D6AC2DD|nr:DUF4846 domain-containing protein [Chitinophaga deserti]